MPDMVKLPGIGEVKKTYVYTGLAITGGAIAWYYIKKKKTATAPASTATGTDPYPPDGTVGDPTDLYSTDPATGMTYGDELSGFTQFGAGTTGIVDTGIGSNGGGDGSSSGGPPFASNDAWSQYVLNYWTSNSLGDPAAMSAALGEYLNAGPMTSAQKSLIDQAVAFAGQVPVPGANGYPPSMHVTGSGGGSSAQNPPPGFKLLNKTANTAIFTWEHQPNATSYQFLLYDGASLVNSRPDLSATTTTVEAPIKPHQKYAAYLRAIPQKSGSIKGKVSFST